MQHEGIKPAPTSGRSAKATGFEVVESKLKSVFEKIFLAGCVILFVMMMVTVADVVGRYLRHPILGADELVGLLMVCLAATALAYCHIHKGHIRLQLLTERLPVKTQIALDIVAYFFCLFGSVLITWRTLVRAQAYLVATRGQVTQIMGIPFFPFILVLGLGFLCLAIVSLVDMISSIIKVVKA
jgi:TRAP-type C4-dicarboxylate transport system permease small subunit